MDILFERRFELLWPTLTEIRQVLKHVLGALSVTRDEADAAGLVATEYLTNLIRHNEGDEQLIMLRINQINHDTYQLTFIDELKPYNLFKQNNSLLLKQVKIESVFREIREITLWLGQ